METHEEKSGFSDIFLRTIAVLGLVAVLLLGAWGIIQLAVNLPGFFGNIGGSVSSLFTHTSKESLTVSTPTNLTSGQTLQVAWKHDNSSGEYSYALSYACESGLSVKAPLPTGSYQTVACNTPFNFVNASEHMALLPSFTGSASQGAPLIVSISATKLSSGLITASGSATTNITPGSSAAAAQTSPKTTSAKGVATKGTSYTYYPATTRAALYGYADLAVYITSAIPSGSRTTLTFTIANIGTNATQSGWTFNANLPINGTYTFASQPQQALYPGDKIAYTLTFDNGYGYNYNQYPYYNPYQYSYSHDPIDWNYNANGYLCGGYTCNTNYVYPAYNYGYQGITITADPFNTILELNKANNTASI